MFDRPVLPEVTPHELAEWLQSKPELVILDVREPFEIGRARLNDPRVVYAPLSRLAAQPDPQLPPEASNPHAVIVVMCHLGMRSAQVTYWLRQIGWDQVYNLRGGIDAYAHDVDPHIGFY